MAITRREFIKANAAAAMGLAAGTAGSGIPRMTAQKKAVRVGVVGTGNRGRHLLSILLGLEGVEVPALCDIQKPHLDMAMELVVKAGRKRPEPYLKDEYT
ncbi:MAG: gfo/Idh/MocA family oxidoreductase, partial [Candidatus Aminicenantaceae bacterium]